MVIGLTVYFDAILGPFYVNFLANNSFQNYQKVKMNDQNNLLGLSNTDGQQCHGIMDGREQLLPMDMGTSTTNSGINGDDGRREKSREEREGNRPSSLPSGQQKVRIFEYRGQRIAGFEMSPSAANRFVCLPQLYELFLKDFVGGLHTIYTKLKRLGIHPVVCCVEQVRALRNFGAIQPGVNRCKLIEIGEFEILYQDCTKGLKPGRPSKRMPNDEANKLGSSSKNDNAIIAHSSTVSAESGGINATVTNSPHSSLILPQAIRSTSFPSFLPNFLNDNVNATATALLHQSQQQQQNQQIAETLNSSESISTSVIPFSAAQEDAQFPIQPNQMMALHRMAMAAAIAMVQQQQQGGKGGNSTVGGNEQRQNVEREEIGRERGDSMETSLILNGELSSSGTSSASTTMHGDLFLEGERRIRHSSIVKESRKLQNSSTANDRSNSDNKIGNSGSSNEDGQQSMMNGRGQSSSNGGDSSMSSGTAKSNSSSSNKSAERRGVTDSVEMILEKLNSVAERVENALKGHYALMQSELDLAKSKMQMVNNLERRKSEMYFQKYTKMRRQFHMERARKRKQLNVAKK